MKVTYSSEGREVVLSFFFLVDLLLESVEERDRRVTLTVVLKQICISLQFYNIRSGESTCTLLFCLNQLVLNKYIVICYNSYMAKK